MGNEIKIMVMKEKIISELGPIFQKTFGKNIKVTESLTANDVDNWNSLNNVMLMSDIESHFGIKFALNELLSMNSVGDLIRSIANHLNQS